MNYTNTVKIGYETTDFVERTISVSLRRKNYQNSQKLQIFKKHVFKILTFDSKFVKLDLLHHSTAWARSYRKR